MSDVVALDNLQVERHPDGTVRALVATVWAEHGPVVVALPDTPLGLVPLTRFLTAAGIDPDVYFNGNVRTDRHGKVTRIGSWTPWGVEVRVAVDDAGTVTFLPL